MAKKINISDKEITAWFEDWWGASPVLRNALIDKMDPEKLGDLHDRSFRAWVAGCEKLLVKLGKRAPK